MAAELKLLVAAPSIKNWPILMGLGILVFVTGAVGLVILIFSMPTALTVSAAGLALTVWPAVKASSTEYVITNLRVSVVSGVVSKSAVEMQVREIKEIHVRANSVQQALGIGDLEVVGQAGSLLLEGVEEPDKVKERIKTLI